MHFRSQKWLALVLFISALTGCSTPSLVPSQESLLTLSQEEGFYANFSELNIKGATVTDLQLVDFDENSHATVAILAMPMEGFDSMYNPVLVIWFSTGKLIKQELFDTAMAKETDLGVWAWDKGLIQYCDIDGDGYPEIITTTAIHGTSGQEIYRRIFKVENGELKTLLKIDDENAFDFGFRGEVLNKTEIKVTNIFTGYNRIINYEPEDISLYESTKEEGMSAGLPSFFIPRDVDNDGIYDEFEVVQYTNLYGSNGFTGWACSVLKFNRSKQSFEVTQSQFFTEKESEKINFENGWTEVS